MRQQRLERRAAPRAFPGAALGAMDEAGGDVGSVIGESVVDLVAVAAMGDATDDNGVDVEPEAEREHQGDGSAAVRC